MYVPMLTTHHVAILFVFKEVPTADRYSAVLSGRKVEFCAFNKGKGHASKPACGAGLEPVLRVWYIPAIPFALRG